MAWDTISLDYADGGVVSLERNGTEREMCKEERGKLTESKQRGLLLDLFLAFVIGGLTLVLVGDIVWLLFGIRIFK